ncbi:PGG domain [Sesbania bispinosa]|nr:PGG domain [Sesbania bispinosa]
MVEVEIESLFNYAMKGQWRKVLEAYENNSRALEAKITKAEDTFLHIAVYMAQTNFLTTLLENIREDVSLAILNIRNSKGKTPLHLAAELGNVDICNSIAKRDPKLILCVNFEGEIPLFLAAVHGMKDAFFCLHGYLQKKDDYSPCIKSNGDTILHSTISNEYFGLALQIIHLYPNLVDSVNEDGLSPLHILAMKPNCFKSSTQMEFLDRVIYNSIGTKDSKAATDDEENLSPSSYLKCEQKRARKEKKLNRLPPNWEVVIRFLTIMMKALLILFGVGASWIEKIQRKKKKHMRAKENIEDSYMMNKEASEKRRKVSLSPILIAAKMGVTEMVEKILDTFPVAIHDVDSDNKNVVLLAIENRQPRVYKLLAKRNSVKESAFRQIDNQGNSALHLAATYREHRPWRVPGDAMQMQWEYKWYKLVKNSMPPNFYARYNNKGQTAKQVFINSHEHLVKEGRKWLTKTSESYSLVAALVATVSFTTSTAIPGGSNEETGMPILSGQAAFNVFAVASLVALCSSVTALVLFLSILTSRYQEKDFAMDLPRKLLLGMTSLWTSITSVLVSFCAGHYYVIEDQLKSSIYLIYALTCLPVSFFVLVQLPLYLDLMLAIFRKVPQRIYKVFSN